MYSGIIDKKHIVPALIGAGLCLFFIKSGFLAFFFLVPLGFLGFKYENVSAWLGLLLAVSGYAIMTLWIHRARDIPAANTIWDLLYFSVMTVIFTWICSPPPGFSRRISGSMRLICGSCIGALLFAAIFLRVSSSPGFSAYIGSLLNALVSAYRTSGADVVQNALMDSLSTETILDLMKSIMLRGGSLVSCILLFFICRQISFAFARITRRAGGLGANSPAINSSGESSAGASSNGTAPVVNPLAAFHVNPSVIWVFSVSLLLVVLARITKFEIPEIILWNILILCVIMYLAQGMGILQFFLAKPSTPPFLRLVLVILFFVLLFSPVINAVLLAGVAILGIAENWVSFRAPASNGPPSTPEAGDGGN